MSFATLLNFLVENFFETVIALVLFFKNKHEYRNTVSTVNNVTEDAKEANDDIGIYVNHNYLPKIYKIDNINDNTIFKKEYLINGYSFSEESFVNRNIFKEFQIIEDDNKFYLESIDGNSMNKSVDESMNYSISESMDDDFIESVEDEFLETTLDVSIQETQYGLIINSIVFVPVNNWHSIVIEQNRTRCIVCDLPVGKPTEHIKLRSHKRNLDNYKPLKKYDSVLTRRIRDKYHCIICNAIFKFSKIKIHFDSKDHEENMLYSTNRAVDVLECNLRNDKDIDFTNSDANSKVIDTQDKNVSSNDERNIWRTHEENSYASTVREPDNFNDKKSEVITLTEESWHMILIPNTSKFYCMACTCSYDLAYKRLHYFDEYHLKKLSECKVIEKYRHFCVRKVGDRYYHCGMCNTLQYPYNIDKHMEIVHHIIVSKTDQDELQGYINNENQTNIIGQTRNMYNANMNHESNENRSSSLFYYNETNESRSSSSIYYHESNENRSTSSVPLHESNENRSSSSVHLHESNENRSSPSILCNEYIYVNQFHQILRLSYMSYHFLIRRINDYICWLCNFSSNEFKMILHTSEPRHMGKINYMYFLPDFGLNLIRVINPVAHCAICNCYFYVSVIHEHIQHPLHISLLTAAIIKSPNYMDNVPNHLHFNQLTFGLPSMNHTTIHVNDSNGNETYANINELSVNQSYLAVNETSINRKDTDLKESDKNLTYNDTNETSANLTNIYFKETSVNLIHTDLNESSANPDVNESGENLTNNDLNESSANLTNNYDNESRENLTEPEFNELGENISNNDAHESSSDLTNNHEEESSKNLTDPDFNESGENVTNNEANESSSNLTYNYEKESSENLIDPELNESGENLTDPELNESDKNLTDPELNELGENLTNPELNESGEKLTDPELNESGENLTDPELNESDENLTDPDLNESGEKLTNPELNESGEYLTDPDLNESGENLTDPEFNESGENLTDPEFNKSGENLTVPELNESGENLTDPELNESGENLTVPELNESGENLTVPELNESGENLTDPEFNESGENLTDPELNKSGENLTVPELNESGENLTDPELNESGENLTVPELNESGENLTVPELNESGEILTDTKLNESGENIMNNNANESSANVTNTDMKESSKNLIHTDLNESIVIVTKTDVNESGINLINNDANESSANVTDHELNESSANQINTDDHESYENQTIEPYNFDCIYLKVKDTYVKVSYKSYNGLIFIGDGSHYCFLCSLRLYDSYQEHVKDKNHLIHLKNSYFIDKNIKHLLRQSSTAYHCVNCNILFIKRELESHMKWAGLHLKCDKKTRKSDFKLGMKLVEIKTTQEFSMFDVPSAMNIIIKIDVRNSGGDFEVIKSDKIVVFNGKCVKISWDSWHGLTKNKKGYHCALCQTNLKESVVDMHIAEEKHATILQNSIEKKFLPSIIRTINESNMHCLTCNVAVLNRNNVFSEHLNGKKHDRNLFVIKKTDLNNVSPRDIIYA